MNSRYIRPSVYVSVFLGFCWFLHHLMDRQPTSRVLRIPSNQTTFPKTIHQIWLGYTRTRPEPWEKAIDSCVAKNVRTHDYKYHLWSLKEIRDLITDKHPNYIETFNAYPHPVQRADAARYIILYHFGGVYLDMDVYCKLSFDDVFKSLQHYDAIVPQTNSYSVSNDVMVAKKNSALMEHLVSNLAAYNGWYVLPYLTVMLTTGPLFVTRCLADFPHPELVYRLPDADYTRRWFAHIAGSTWHEADGVILWGIYVHRFYISVTLITLTFTIILLCYTCRRRRKIRNI